MPSFPSLTAKDVIKILVRAGFTLEGQSGGHKQYVGIINGKKYKVTVPCHGNKNLKPGTVNSIIRQSGLGKIKFYGFLIIVIILKFMGSLQQYVILYTAPHPGAFLSPAQKNNPPSRGE